jgi:hypothetical protein
VALVTAGIRIYPTLALGNHGPDFENYRQMGEAALRGDDVYAAHPLFPYMPYSQVVPALCVGVGELSGVPFQVLLKLVNLLGDVLLAVGLLLALWRRAGPKGAILWTLAFALNPVSILVSAFHGNLMELVPVFVGLALVAGDLSREAPPESARPLVASAALLLGIAVAFRSFPLLLVPAFAFWVARTLRGRAAFAALALAPSAVSALPYLVWSAPDFLKEVSSYSGTPDIGWLGALRAVSLLVRDLKLFEFGPELLGPSKLLFLLAFAVSFLVLPFATGDGRRRAALLPPLLFVGLYGGVAAQYLVWGIPVAVLARDRRLAGYTALATAAMLAHYLVYHPSILLAGPPAGPTEGFFTHLVLVAGNAGLAAFCCAWAVRVAREESASAPPAIRRALLAGALVVAALFAVLVGRGVLEARRALSVPVTAGPA